MMRRAASLLLLLLVAACGGTEQGLFVVLPNPDGSAGQITVEAGGKSVVLDKPLAAAEVKDGNAQAAGVSTGEVQKIFAAALAARPIPPAHFELYFVADSDQLTTASEQQYQNVFQDIKKRSAYEVEVVGHTDTMGEADYNQQLSLKRAIAIRARLMNDGLTGDAITATGRGKLDLAVPTGDQVPEPRNRRVEITVR